MNIQIILETFLNYQIQKKRKEKQGENKNHKITRPRA